MTEAPLWMFTKALSHRQKVLRLYKRALRECDNYFSDDVLEVRYQKVIMRARFDAYKNECDIRKAKIMLMNGCHEIWIKRHPKPFFFSNSPGGCAFERERESDDKILDTESWTYVEREQFPYYFNKREKRKKELLEHWEKIEDGWDGQITSIQRRPPSEAKK